MSKVTTKAEAKRRLLGFCINMMTSDDEVCFGPIGEEPESREFKLLDAARGELVREFQRRTIERAKKARKT